MKISDRKTSLRQLGAIRQTHYNIDMVLFVGNRVYRKGRLECLFMSVIL